MSTTLLTYLIIIIIIIIILFGTLNIVHEVQLVNNNMTEQLNSDPRTLKSLFSL